MPNNKKRLLGIALALVLGASVYFAIAKLTNSSASPAAAGAQFPHPAIEEMDGASGDPAALQAALERNPTHVPVLVRLGQLALEKGDAATAVRHLEEAVSIQPDNADARLELGRALYQAGDVDRAIEVTGRILETQPNHVDALYNLGAIHANRNDTATAREYWNRAVAAGRDTASGGNAQRGLDVLNGRTLQTMPDIPEHRGLPVSTPSPAARDAKEELLQFIKTQ